jgi:hypothetical protein
MRVLPRQLEQGANKLLVDMPQKATTVLQY